MINLLLVHTEIIIFYGEEKPLSVNVGYTFDNGNKLGFDFSRFKEETQKKGSPNRTFMAASGAPINPMTPYQDKIQTIWNDIKRTDYAITYHGSDDKQDWMFRAYKSVFDKNYKNQNLTRMTMGGHHLQWKLQAPKIDTIKRTLSVIEGRIPLIWVTRTSLPLVLNIVRIRA